MFVSVRIQFHNHLDTQPVKRFDRAMRYQIWNVASAQEWDSQRKCHGSSAHLRTIEGTLVIRKSARLDNNDSELKSQARLHFRLSLGEANFLPRRKLKFFKDTHCQKHSVSFPMSEWEPRCFGKRQLQTTIWENTKINCKTTGGVPSQIWPFPRVKTMFCLPCKSIQC